MDTLKDFSDYALNQGWCVDGESTQNGFLFYNAQTNERWIGWQAAKSQAIPEGFVLVPKEPTKDTLIEVASVCIGDDFANLDEARNLYKAAIKEAIEAREVS